MKINGGNIRPPDANGNCPAGWYLCPSNICVYDKGGQNPIVPDHHITTHASDSL